MPRNELRPIGVVRSDGKVVLRAVLESGAPRDIPMEPTVALRWAEELIARARIELEVQAERATHSDTKGAE